MKSLKLQLRKRNVQLAAAVAILVVGSAVGVGFRVGAFTNNASTPPTTVVEHADNVNVNNPAPVIQEVGSEVPLGAASLDLPGSNVLNVNGFETYYLVGKVGNGAGRATTTVAFANPFKIATTTNSDVILEQVTDGFGYTGATSTVTLVEIAGKSATTTVEWDCSASATQFVTSTPAIVNTEQMLTTSTPYVVRSGVTSSTSPGSGSHVQLSSIATFMPVTNILLTPQKPYLVCKVWQPYGTTLGTFTDSTGTADVRITAQVQRQR